MALLVRDLGRCSYADALSIQEELVSSKHAGVADDYLLTVEHDPVFTLGRGADAADLRGADRSLGIPVFRVSRGGGVTFHGPGQLVVYPIVALRQRARDVHRYVRALESILIDVCADFGIAAERREAQTGVWVGPAKIASIGVGVRRWVTLHGLALNVSTDLRFFEHIVPCRMPGMRMTSLELELGAAPALAEVRAAFVRHFRAALPQVVMRSATSRIPECLFSCEDSWQPDATSELAIADLDANLNLDEAGSRYEPKVIRR